MVVALCTAVALPASARAEAPAAAAKPAPYEMAGDAEPVEGTTSSADGPELKSGRDYADALGRSDKLYYRLTLDAKSNAHLSAVAAAPPGSKVEFGDGIKMTLQATDGTECDSADSNFGGSEYPRPLAVSVSRLAEPDGDCQAAGSYLLSVERTSEPTATPVEWPLELRFMTEPGVKGGPTAALAEGSWSTEPPAAPTEQPKGTEGGTGFNDAPATGQGTWKDRLEPGETLFYRVPVDWGQQLSAVAELANATLKGGGTSPFVGSGLLLRLHNTVRAPVDSADAIFNGEQTAAQLLTAPAGFANRFDSDTGTSAMRFAGWHYVSVSLSPEVAEHAKGGVDLTLRLKLRGKAQPAPAYDGDAAAAGFAVTDHDTEQAEKGQTAAEAGESDTLRIVGAAGIGAGTVLVLALGAWMLVARRRAAAPAGPGPT
ncbi:MAG TPA: hypothetical protein DEQ61_16980, partial [Streptomyces sp.]|nr:hypothetical protein [Streptomyces sp.]